MSPDDSRLALPSFNLPENPTHEQVTRAMQDAILSIAENLRHLRHQESGNTIAIRVLERRVEQLEAAVLP